MKKFILVCIGIFCFTFSVLAGDCTVPKNGEDFSISKTLDNCLQGSQLVPGTDANIETGFKQKMIGITQGLALFLGVLAVGTIVYGSFLMTTSAGEDDKIKKAKDVVKWGIIGFLCLISASAVIVLIVNIMFFIGGTN